MAAVPIIIYNTRQEEQPPASNCEYTVKQSEGIWRCFDEKQYIEYQKNQEIQEKIQNEKLIEYHFPYHVLGVLIISIIFGIYQGKKLDEVGIGFVFFLIGLFMGAIYLIIVNYIILGL